MEVPQLIRNIGEDKWQHGEYVVKSGLRTQCTVEMYSGFSASTTKWLYVVLSEDGKCYRVVYDKAADKDWRMRTKDLVL